jgi:hypothetical protein
MSTMATGSDRPDAALPVRVLRLHALAMGLGCGVLVGLALFVATNWLVVKGGDVVGPHLELLAQFLPGYTVTFAGSLLGLAYGFLAGLVGGSLLSAVYNRIALRAPRGGVGR